MRKYLAAALISVFCSCLNAQEDLVGTVEHIEITQTIQDEVNSVPLVAGKTTAIRIYLNPGDVASGEIYGELYVLTSSSNIELKLRSLNKLSLDPNNAHPLARKRASLRESLNFTLAGVDASPGKLKVLRLTLHRVQGNQVTNIATFNHNLVYDLIKVPPLRLKIIGIRYHTANDVYALSPRQIDFELLQSWLRRAYPISDLIVSQYTIDTELHEGSFNCLDVNAILLHLRKRDLESGTDSRFHYYGLVAADPDHDFVMRGCSAGVASTPNQGVVASGPSGSPGDYAELDWEHDESFAGWYAGHEIGHTLGRRHPGVCSGAKEEDYDTQFPSGRWISGDGQSFVGYDVGYSPRKIGQSALPGKQWSDVMDYCDHQWISAYTYNAIRERLIVENLPNISGQILTTKASDSRRSASESRIATKNSKAEQKELTGRTDTSRKRSVDVIATVNLLQVSGAIQFISPGTVIKERQLPTDKQVTLKVIGPGGTVLGEYPQEVLASTDASLKNSEAGIVDTELLIPDNTIRIELYVKGVRVDSKTLQNVPRPRLNINVPERFAKPHLGDSASAGAPGPSILTWSVEGARRENLTYDVQVSGDRERTWNTIASGLRKNRMTLDPFLIGTLANATFRVIASDGLNQSAITSKLIELSSNDASLKQHVKWSIAHEGCPVFFSAIGIPPKDDRTPIVDLRNCVQNKQKHNQEALRIVERASDTALKAVVEDAIVEIPEEYELMTNFKWVCLHEGKLAAFETLVRVGDYPAIRQQFAMTQAQNPKTTNILNAVSDKYLADMVLEVAADSATPGSKPRLIYFQKESDNGIVVRALKSSGLLFDTGRSLNDVPSNVLWVGDRVNIGEVKKIALALIDAGVDLKTIKRFYNSSGSKSMEIQIGGYHPYSAFPSLTKSAIASLTQESLTK